MIAATLAQFVTALTEPTLIIKTLGVLGIILVVFAESGLFFGFFLPGDSLLFTAGILASKGYLPPGILFFGVLLAAILGDNVGYSFGRHVGLGLFSKDDSFLFNKKYPARAEAFYEKYGIKTLVLARFVPVVRTFVPIIAGVAKMNYKTFFTYNVLGAILWTVLILGAGYLLGRIVPNALEYIQIIIIGIIVISIIPFVKYLFDRRRKPLV